MSSYCNVPMSPSTGFFPSAPGAPHAFSGMHGGDPREAHDMYAALGSSFGFRSDSQGSPNQNRNSMSSLKKLVRRS
ncbi:hypothetical protein CONPUDRAFT_79312 [Coniophora puteana RWD-64-598 SS2]|uniref:Uncharacterized protein n=1 Tax=Coniophora puteana (strain RWD-64-598) TaxID=741705 RepID=A0A5M3N7S4_CONPW|nr:uncharacterized protein CONPUDRAFT_79312 [Coniophora puteana RWD-64-598 SS2]EIW87154.1 hypothetical protein CONPUDRAFT_79312 [Coniophora puteana RWD-64-598 SS2]